MSQVTVLCLSPDPGPVELAYCRRLLVGAGIDPTNQGEVINIAVHGVSPLALVAAAQQLTVTFVCRDCGRKLDPTESDACALGLCLPCLDDAGLENEHADGGHTQQRHPDCPDCPDCPGGDRGTFPPTPERRGTGIGKAPA